MTQVFTSNTALNAAATRAGVAITDQGQPRDSQSIAADLARVVGQLVELNPGVVGSVLSTNAS